MKPLILAAALAILSSAALAHPGGHSEFAGPVEAVAHLATSPFHVALVLGALVTGIVAIRTTRRLKARNVR